MFSRDFDDSSGPHTHGIHVYLFAYKKQIIIIKINFSIITEYERNFIHFFFNINTCSRLMAFERTCFRVRAETKEKGYFEYFGSLKPSVFETGGLDVESGNRCLSYFEYRNVYCVFLVSPPAPARSVVYGRRTFTLTSHRDQQSRVLPCSPDNVTHAEHERVGWSRKQYANERVGRLRFPLVGLKTIRIRCQIH